MSASETASAPEFFAYESTCSNDLQQGDVLAATENVRAILQKYHARYAQDHYSHFIVLTQSCDLVRRSGSKPKARYVTLAGVRSLDEAIEREIAKRQGQFELAAGVCSSKYQGSIVEFLRKLLNNNQSGYFYLHQDVEVGFPTSAVAFLRLSIALKTSEHYDVLLESRLFSLIPIFQAKLGWLAGNMYSRVGTPDWTPDFESEKDFNERIKNLIDGASTWVDDKKLGVVKKNVKDPESVSQEELRSQIESVDLPASRELVLEAIQEELEAFSVDLSPDQLEKFRRRLVSNPKFARQIKGK